MQIILNTHYDNNDDNNNDIISHFKDLPVLYGEFNKLRIK